MKKSSKSSPARDYLRAISVQLRPAAAMRGLSVNDLLTEYYSELADSNDWGTFNQWKKRGYLVQKGESGFAVWSRPQKLNSNADTDTSAAPDAAPDTDAGTPDEKPAREKFFVAYIFCARQVANREQITPDGREYAPSGLIPPHATAAQGEQPADAAPDTDASAQPEPTPAPEPTPSAQPEPKPEPSPVEQPSAQPAPAPSAPQYIEQLALAI